MRKQTATKAKNLTATRSGYAAGYSVLACQVQSLERHLEELWPTPGSTRKSPIIEAVDQMIQVHVLKQVTEIRNQVSALERGEPERFAAHLAALRHEILGLPEVPDSEWTPEISAEVKSCRAHSYKVRVLRATGGKLVVVHGGEGAR